MGSRKNMNCTFPLNILYWGAKDKGEGPRIRAEEHKYPKNLIHEKIIGFMYHLCQEIIVVNDIHLLLVCYYYLFTSF